MRVTDLDDPQDVTLSLNRFYRAMMQAQRDKNPGAAKGYAEFLCGMFREGAAYDDRASKNLSRCH